MLTQKNFKELSHVDTLIHYDYLSAVFELESMLYVSWAASRLSDMFLKASQSDIDLLKNDQIDIRHFFERCKEFYIVEYKKDQEPVVSSVSFGELDRNYFIPDSGVYLNK